MADGLERLLNYLAEREIIHQEQKEVQLSAGPREPAETVVANQQIVRERERERIAELGPAFAAGLRRPARRPGDAGPRRPASGRERHGRRADPVPGAPRPRRLPHRPDRAEPL